MKKLAMEMAIAFKNYMELENENGKVGDTEKATYYMNKKWETSRAAEDNGIKEDFDAALKELKVF